MAIDKKAIIALPELDRNSDRGVEKCFLTLSTYKGSRGLVSHAKVYFVNDGYETFEMFGDFSKQICATASRATQSAIDKQHAQVFNPEAIYQLQEEARQFYAAKKERQK